MDFEALAEKMRRRKERLLAGGVPPAGEERMVQGLPRHGRLARAGREAEAAQTPEEAVVIRHGVELTFDSSGDGRGNTWLPPLAPEKDVGVSDRRRKANSSCRGSSRSG